MSLAPIDSLPEILRARFGFETFRPYQEAVCRAAVEGRDLLLVMPTGAGKSLCYQLPGIARGGTTLVISPLIALMEDQVTKLQRMGFTAERIHAGRERAESRAVCVDYLDGKLDFLFIAPERLAVAGFPEMLAKRKPSLIAIDEAHCISQWGHDFRPEYRMLGLRLPALRPAPVIALTATATPLVQDDILKQLGLVSPLRFIHGFRRTNIAVEVAEVPPSARGALLAEKLQDPALRPAIVYAPSRKAAEALALTLGEHFSTAAYHAGISNEKRDDIQTRFLNGSIEVMVATIAFGMGVDKSNVRSVFHMALPSSVEAYYQEIGRAGRDGAPSKAILMWSYADRRTHEFFQKRNYPDVQVLDLIHDKLGKHKIPKQELLDQLRLEPEEFEQALEKLWIHGGAAVDPDETVSVGAKPWRASYVAQQDHKLDQLTLISQFAEGSCCRMIHLVGYFGDREDSGEPCGICDVCAPQGSLVRAMREPTPLEESLLTKMMTALRERDEVAVGTLYRNHFESTDRKVFERLLSALLKAELVYLTDESFKKDGREITYRVITLTAAGRKIPSVRGLVQLSAEIAAVKAPKKTKLKASAKVGVNKATPTPEPTPELAARIEALKAWRLNEARKHRVPAFTILHDKTLTALAEHRPTSRDEMLRVHGIGAKLAEKYGDAILGVLA